VSHAGIEGVGEMAPVGYGTLQTAESAERDVSRITEKLVSLEPWDVRQVEAIANEAGIGSATAAALNMACWDWLGKRANLPLYRLFGLQAESEPTSITIGICEPAEVRERAAEIAADNPQPIIKLKLGSGEGIQADQARFSAATDGAASARIRVDANGGWSTTEAIAMMQWLAAQGCEYVEQPVNFEDVDAIGAVFSARSLPMFLDENIRYATDVAEFAGRCDGINVKLMKSGGISEGVRCVHAARAHGLKTMIGCMTESSVAIGAGASIGALFDYIDLDSQFNMDPDPAEGLAYMGGRVMPSEAPGLGVRVK
jgi:L-alanine-DL-glutamate epimerase-like enolase superfamily enzyme